MPRVIVDYSLILFVASGLLVSQLLIKHSMRQVGEISAASLAHPLVLIQQALSNPWLVIGLGLSCAMGAIWLVILSRLELSFAAPMLGAVYYILLLAVTAVVLGERVSYARWVGAILVVAGITLISRTH
jgi:drug/metabolite transporter (DMT)-like permease